MGSTDHRNAPVIRIKLLLCALLALVLTFSLSFCSDPLAYAAEPGSGTVVNCNYSVNVRSGPGTGYSVIGHAPKGAVYDVTGKSGSWYKIDFGGKTGYIYSKYLSVTYDTAPQQLGRVVNCNYYVNVRSGPGTQYKKTGTAPKDEVYAVTGKSGSWYRISYNGKTGYIYSRYLSVYSAVQDTVIEGYYASWAAYGGYGPEDIPAEKLDVVAYAFAVLDSGLNVVMGDPGIDPANFAKLKELKEKYPHLKAIISVGGWLGSGRFSDAALSGASRSAFAESAVSFMKRYGFDGIDIDWEHPVSGGLSTNKRRPEDKTNFTLMMAALRERLDAQGSKDGCHYLLTFAGASEKFYTDNVELSKLAAYADFAVVMTYDIHGPWNSYADFNSPLYTPQGSSPQSKWSCDAAVKLWESCGFPASKIVMGVPFYGYRYTGVNSTNSGLFQKYSSAGDVMYDKIMSMYLGGMERHWHTEACVPWLYGGGAFISYDDPQSIALKAAYIKRSGLKGAGIWELSQNGDGTLLDVIFDNMR